MFPFEKIMIVSGNPSFDDPTKSDARILRRFESVVAKQGLKFGQTGLYPPAYFRNRTPPHFEYRIYEGKTTSSPYEAINFDFTKRKDALRIYSNIPEIKATPIINFIAKHYLHVQLRGGVTPKDTRFYSRCADACLYVKLHHNKKKGIDARWRTLAQYAKPSDAKCRRKHRDAAPGVVPTLIGG